MGFVTTPETGHEAVALAVSALGRLAHRGGLDADGKSGDGAGLLIGQTLALCDLPLRDPRCQCRLAVFHPRSSTNTVADWRLAQPFRMLAHNGEINTITGNRAWMRARETELDADVRGSMWREGS